MPVKTPARKTAGIGDAAVRKATGRSWDEWFAILDKAGARKMPHRDIATLLHKLDCGDWWSQMVTVGYEQARGLRVKHQTATGYSVSRSKTIAAPAGKIFGAWKIKKQRDKWLDDAALTIRKATANKSLRITWDKDATNVDVMLYPKDKGKTQVAVQHNKLPSAKDAARMKTYWAKRLAALAAVVA